MSNDLDFMYLSHFLVAPHASWPKAIALCFLNTTSVPLLMLNASPTSLSKFICSSMIRPYVPSSVKFPQISLRHLFSLGASTDMNLTIYGEKTANLI